MIRKIVIAAFGVIALMLGLLSLEAGAQTDCPYNLAILDRCPVDLPVIGPPQGTTVGATTGFAGRAPADTASVTTQAPPSAPAAAAPIATTGTESRVLGYVGSGLIAFGALAMGYRRILTNDHAA